MGRCECDVSLVAGYQLNNWWHKNHRVTEETADGPPSRRANATLTPDPSGNYLWCIGGEYFSEDGKAVCMTALQTF